MYARYAPDKLHDAGFLDATMAKYEGKEHQMLKALVRRYGPEPTEDSADAAVAADGTDRPRSRFAVLASKAANASWRTRVRRMYRKYLPDRLSADPGIVDATLARYPGKEHSVLQKLVERLGPEPDEADCSDGGAEVPSPAPC